MPFVLRKLREVLIIPEAWSKCALGQIVSKDMFFHSRKYLIGVVLSLEVLDCSCTSTRLNIACKCYMYCQVVAEIVGVTLFLVIVVLPFDGFQLDQQ
ncbi:hypothetical protein L1987_80993 [Smallanthus sonchifolius]|uniref:Uncharacterized protein n=1 Tax=Smallanthus sonchifolius TaxID=185202 RepID=A0ACB8YNH6_9ASTR|nr:hypothetical protein L1987_80993 [Smallanthus sonchifolius]